LYLNNKQKNEITHPNHWIKSENHCTLRPLMPGNQPSPVPLDYSN
jgi:hypothetical protein